VVSTTELYEELEKSIKQNKTNYSKIGSGYTKVKSSRFQLEENEFSTNRAFPQLNAVFKGLASDLEMYLSLEENTSLNTYQIENASVLWDTTYRPHYQKPDVSQRIIAIYMINLRCYGNALNESRKMILIMDTIRTSVYSPV